MWTWWIIVPIIAIIAFQNHRKTRWVEKLESIILSVKIPKNSEKGPTSAEMMFASLHGILRPTQDLKKEGAIQEHISFEMVADAKSITFYVWTPKHLQNFVEGQVYAQYPTAEISAVDDYTKDVDIDHDGKEDCIAGCELKLIKPDYFPIKTFMNFEVDPLAGITGALSKIEDHAERMWIQILTRPVSDSWRNKGLQYAENLKNGTGPSPFSKAGAMKGLSSLPITLLHGIFDLLMPSEDSKGGGSQVKLPHNMETSLACLEEKANKLGYEVKIRLVYIAKSKELARQHLRITAGAFKQFNTTIGNGFIPTKIRTGQDVLDEYRARLFVDKGFVLNIEEVASLYHLPHASVETPNIVWTSSKKGEPPSNLPYEGAVNSEDLTVFAETTFRGQPKRFGIQKDDRRRHMYIIGKSGTGKSKLLEILAVDDIERGHGIGIVDPHGELVFDVLKRIPANRINDVVYVNPADKDFPVGFNPLETTPEFREETTSGFIVALERLFGYSWGPRLEYVLRYTVLALTYTEDATMLSIIRMLTDKDYRKRVLENVEDPVVKTFWLKEWTTYNDRFQAEAVAPILNKVGQFTASPIIRNIVGQAKGTIDFAEAINNQKILLVDLSTGKIGEDNAELLGSFIITKLQLAAMARSKMRPEDRKDFYLYVDEFQNFATTAFATILSEARKYKLNLTLANQYIAQMEETVRDAVFGNVGTLISFRVGATDAAYLEREFSPVFEKNDLINLDNQHLYLNMLIDGITTIPFSAKTIFATPADPSGDNTEKIVQASRERYSITRQEIEDKIARWTNIDKIDVGARIDKQEKSRFEKTNMEIEQEMAEKKNFRIKKPYEQRNIQNDLQKVQVKKSINPDELKKIIQRVTQPSAEQNQVSTLKKSEISENNLRQSGEEESRKIQSIPEKSEKEENIKSPLKLPVSQNTKNYEQKETIREKLENQLGNDTTVENKRKTFTNEVKKEPAIQQMKIKDNNQKSNFSDGRKQTTVAGSNKPKTEYFRTEKNKIEPASLEKEQAAENKVKPSIKIIRFSGSASAEKAAFPKPANQTQPIKADKDKQQNATPIRVSNLNQNKKVINPAGIPAIMTKKFIPDDDNIRKLTREEFLKLREIQPNEKIVIVD